MLVTGFGAGSAAELTPVKLSASQMAAVSKNIKNSVTLGASPSIEPVLAKIKAEQPQLAAIRAQQAAQLAAQQAAQAQQQASAQQQAQAPTVVSPVSGSCIQWLAQAGITDVADAMIVINRESGCNPNAMNASSGACGIGQQLPCGKWPHVWNDPVGALIDMQAYVFGRYGSWAAAVVQEQLYGYY